MGGVAGPGRITRGAQRSHFPRRLRLRHRRGWSVACAVVLPAPIGEGAAMGTSGAGGAANASVATPSNPATAARVKIGRCSMDRGFPTAPPAHGGRPVRFNAGDRFRPPPCRLTWRREPPRRPSSWRGGGGDGDGDDDGGASSCGAPRAWRLRAPGRRPGRTRRWQRRQARRQTGQRTSSSVDLQKGVMRWDRSHRGPRLDAPPSRRLCGRMNSS